MKFYDREEELELLNRNWQRTEAGSMMTVMIGRRRTGKTTLLTTCHADIKQLLYLYVSKDNERVLVRKFQQSAEQVLGLHIFGQTDSFAQFFEELMRYGEEHHFTVVFDEFQNFLKVNAAIPGHIQDIWDRYHLKTKVNMIACGSIYSMMHKLFDNEDEPLYGRQDCRIIIRPFRLSVLKQILADHYPQYTSEDLLCLYALSGGVAKYVAWLMDAKAFTKQKMLRFATSDGSPYLTEGTELIMSEFGRDYTNYMSIMQLIAGGLTSQGEIDGVIGKNTGAYLANLSEEYNYVQRRQPMFSKPNSRNQRWMLEDCFLRFWFRFIVSNQGLVETGRNDLLLELVERDYVQYSGWVLEQYFRRKWVEEKRVTRVGSYWDRKGENEIDIIALNDIDRTAMVMEVKRKATKYNARELERKASVIAGELSKYKVSFAGLSMDDM